jgi:glycosyltransferase involved in cell wall biosynthesis
MKKILIWETLSLVSGGQRMTLTIMDLLKNDYEFHCLIPSKGALSNELDSMGIPYTLLGDQTMPTGIKGKKVIFRYAWLSIKAISKALGVIAKHKPDLIYAPGPAALPWSAICGMLLRRPVLWHLHHIFLDGATKKLLNFFSGFKSVKNIISVSDVVGEQIGNVKATSKIVTFYNPVDYSKFSSGDGSRILDELKLDKNGKIILGQVALLQPLKQQDIVIKTAVELKRDGRDIKVLLAGRSRDEDTPYVEHLRKMIDEAGMTDDVYLMGQRSDVPDILSVVDLVMIPSSFEGFPLAGLEAAAAGCPVLAADVGGAKEFIEASGAGECFSFSDVCDAATHVISVLEKKDHYASAGQSFAVGCSPENYAANIRKLLVNIM